MAPLLIFDYATSPFRNGPDMVSYAKISQFLLDGGLLKDALEFKEYISGYAIGEINKFSDATLSWSPIYFFRWAFSAYQSVIAIFSASKSPYEVMFLSMTILSLLVFFYIFKILSFNFKRNKTISLLGALCFILNVNIINIWYEGFYANFFSLIFILFYLDVLFFNEVRVNKRTLASLIFVTTAFIFSYPEAIIFIFLPLLTLTILLEKLISKAFNLERFYLLVLCALISTLIFYPLDFFWGWINISLRQIVEQGGNGYPQPYWAFPHEIFGLNNIYLNSKFNQIGQIFARPYFNLFLSIIGIGLLLYIFINYVDKAKDKNNFLYLSAIFLTFISLRITFANSPGNNYAYMKMYVTLLPVLFIAFWRSFIFYFEHRKFFIFEKNSFFIIFISIWICFNGFIYIIQYKKQLSVITANQLNLSTQFKKYDPTKNITFLILKPKDNNIENILYRNSFSAISSCPWVIPELFRNHKSLIEILFKIYGESNILILAEKDSSITLCGNLCSMIYQNNSFSLYDTHMKLNQLDYRDDGGFFRK